MQFRVPIRNVFISGKSLRAHEQPAPKSGNNWLRSAALPAFIICILVERAVSTVYGAESDAASGGGGGGGGGVRPWNHTALDLLRMNLFVNYDKNLQPTANNGAPTKITLGMAVNYIDIDEINGKMTLHCWLRICWTDSNRTWNPVLYENITKIHLKTRDVWRPQITLFNSAGEGGDYLGDTQIILTHDGNLLWVPPAVYGAYCSLDLELWPYDKQTCKLNVGSWTLTQIDTQNLTRFESLDYNELVQSTEWEIIDSKVQFHEKEYYNYLQFSFNLMRRSSMYSAVIFTPAACIIVLTLSAFWLPPQLGEKILLNGIVILIIAAFLMYFAQLLPILAENTPLIVLFYSTSLLLLSISTTIAVMTLYLSTARHKRRVPDFLKNLLHGPLGNVLLLAHFTVEAEPHSLIGSANETKELSDNVYEQPDDLAHSINAADTEVPSVRSIQFNWILLATAIDRIFFLIYCFLFIVLAIVYSV